MFTKSTLQTIVAAITLLAVGLACAGQAPEDIVSDAQGTATINAANTQAYLIVNGTATPGAGPTNTRTVGEEAEVSANATFAAQTGVPTYTQTALPKPTNTPTAYLLTQPTATVVPAQSDGVVVYNQVVALCQGGAPYVTVGMVTIPCTGNVLPPPSGNDNIVNASMDQPNLSGMDSNCPTNGEMFAAHGWGTNGVKAVKDGINVEWEGCGKWQVQAVGIGTFRLHMLEGYQYTVTRANGVVTVYYGDGSWITVWGATIRYLPSYTSMDQSWVHDAMVLMIREFNYGYSMDPRYGTVNGNLDIPAWVQPKVDTQTCPLNVYQAAAMLGGDDYRFWTEPDHSGGAWVFNSKGDGFHHLTHPGAGYFDVWTADQGAISVYASGKGIFEKLNFEEASFHCK